MRDFEFVRTNEVAGSWEPGDVPDWCTGEGELFFLATWSQGNHHYGWFGIYHDSLSHLAHVAKGVAKDLTEWSKRRCDWPCMARVSRQTPGWGFVCATENKLQLWRDPLGRLPIFWMYAGDGVEWATRPAKLNGFSPRIRRARINRFLTRLYDQGRDDFWQGVSRLAAGEILEASARRKKRLSAWWPPEEDPLEDETATTSRVGDLLVESIVGVVETGGGGLVSLSGGVDSTLLLALMTEKSGLQPRTISMVDPSTRLLDEREIIESAQEALDVEGEFFDLRGKLAWENSDVHHPIPDFGPAWMSEAAYIRPFLDTVANQQSTRSEPRVLISGHGADHLFGCSYYLFSQADAGSFAGWCEDIRRRSWKQVIKKSSILFGWRYVPARINQNVYPPWLRYPRRLPDIQWSPLYDPERWLQYRRNRFRRWSWEYSVRQMERYRRTTGILRRLPYLDPHVVRICLRLLPPMLRNKGHSKWPLRILLKDWVPNSITFRRGGGLFDEIVWRGIFQYLKPDPVELVNEADGSDVLNLSISKLREYMRVVRNKHSGLVKPYGHEVWRVLAALLWVKELHKFDNCPQSR